MQEYLQLLSIKSLFNTQKNFSLLFLIRINAKLNSDCLEKKILIPGTAQNSGRIRYGGTVEYTLAVPGCAEGCWRTVSSSSWRQHQGWRSSCHCPFPPCSLCTIVHYLVVPGCAEGCWRTVSSSSWRQHQGWRTRCHCSPSSLLPLYYSTLPSRTWLCWGVLEKSFLFFLEAAPGVTNSLSLPIFLPAPSSSSSSATLPFWTTKATFNERRTRGGWKGVWFCLHPQGRTKQSNEIFFSYNRIFYFISAPLVFHCLVVVTVTYRYNISNCFYEFFLPILKSFSVTLFRSGYFSIPDLRSNNCNKRGGRKNLLSCLLCNHKFHKVVNYFILNMYRKKFEPIDKELWYLLPKKLSLSSQKYGFGILVPEKTYPGSRSPKGTGSQIRIRNTS